MGMTQAEFQAWLNAHGASLTVDGKAGPKTRQAVLDVFTNRNLPRVSDAQVAMFALRLGGTSHQVNAVAIVESGGRNGMNRQGQPEALYERHYAWKRLRILLPLLSNPTPGGYTIDADGDGLNDSWEKIADMSARDPVVAFESASFGKFQIMGAWATKLGYANAIEFAYALTRSEAAHYEALVRYIESFNGVAKFRRISTNPADCLPFAEFFNGPKQKGYHERIAAAMR